MKKSIKRSPLFYVGDKYKLMNQLVGFFPKKVNAFFEPFVGGGTVFLNISAKKYFLNDVNKNLIAIHNLLIKSAQNPSAFLRVIEKVTQKYKLSRSYKEDIVPSSLKEKWKKTYFARFNKEGYEKLRACVNNERENDPLILYILLIYGFNRMLRFNGWGKFNLPVGNVDFNKNVVSALNAYFEFVENKHIELTAKDFRSFFSNKRFSRDDFVYLDPPYLIASSEYNKLWDRTTESDLLKLIDTLHLEGVRFALSNVTHYNGHTNDLLLDWMGKYKVHNIKSNYINYHDNGKKRIKEVLVTNY